MSHSVKIYDTCIGCTQCVRACPTDVLEMIPWNGCKAKQIASAPRTEDCVGCKRCESACPTDFLSIRVYLSNETTRSMGLAYWYVRKNSTGIFQKSVLQLFYFYWVRVFMVVCFRWFCLDFLSFHVFPYLQNCKFKTKIEIRTNSWIFLFYTSYRHSDSNRDADARALLPKSSVSTNFTMAACEEESKIE